MKSEYKTVIISIVGTVVGGFLLDYLVTKKKEPKSL